MNLKDYLSQSNRGEAKRIAANLGVSMSFLSQMASGKSAISPERCVEIEKITNGMVTRKHLYPDRWHLIWPEIASHDFVA